MGKVNAEAEPAAIIEEGNGFVIAVAPDHFDIRIDHPREPLAVTLFFPPFGDALNVGGYAHGLWQTIS